MNKILALAFLLVVGCGDPTDVKHGRAPVDPTPTPEVTVPITDVDLIPKRWVATDGSDYIMVDLEHKFNTDEDMFHFRLCENGPCNDYLFFAVGTFKLNADNQLCFNDINYWIPPPADFFIQDNTPFCGTGTLNDGALTVVFETTRGQKTLQFTSEEISF